MNDFTDPASLTDATGQYRDALLAELKLMTELHRRRGGFYAALDRWVKVLPIVIGVAILAFLLNQDSSAVLRSTIVLVVVSALGFVFDFACKSKFHDRCAHSYADLEADMLAKSTWAPNDVWQCRSQMRRMLNG